jgi:hypothetical protein
MPTLLNALDLLDIRERIGTLRFDAPARWGKMNAPRMVCHLIDAFRVPLGELEAKPKGGPLRWKWVRRIFIYTLPWPKGRVPTMPEYLTTQPSSWDSDVASLVGLVDRFARQAPTREDFAPHPAFGELDNVEWAELAYRHTDHHLRQFGA